jgi:hypothetical protein
MSSLATNYSGMHTTSDVWTGASPHLPRRAVGRTWAEKDGAKPHDRFSCVSQAQIGDQLKAIETDRFRTVQATNRWVPHISLVFREIWDTTALSKTLLATGDDRSRFVESHISRKTSEIPEFPVRGTKQRPRLRLSSRKAA